MKKLLSNVTEVKPQELDLSAYPLLRLKNRKLLVLVTNFRKSSGVVLHCTGTYWKVGKHYSKVFSWKAAPQQWEVVRGQVTLENER